MKYKKQLDKKFILIRNLVNLTKNEKIKWQYLNNDCYTLTINDYILTLKHTLLDGIILTINNCNNIIYNNEYRYYNMVIYLYRIVKKQLMNEIHINKTDLLIENINNILETRFKGV